jgi:hypothetical protein
MLTSKRNSFPFNGSFWRDQDKWPRDWNGYTFLARAFQEVGRALFPDAWPKSRWDNEPVEPQEPDQPEDPYAWNEEAEDQHDLAYDRWEQERDRAEIEFENKWSAVLQKIAEECEGGTLVSAVRAKEGGDMVQLASYCWNTENFATRFFRCDISLADPFTVSRFRRSHWIYIRRDSLDRFLKKNWAGEAIAQPNKTESSHRANSGSSTEKAPKGRAPKDKIRSELREIFADPKNDRPNDEQAWDLIRTKLDVRRTRLREVLKEPEFADKQRRRGERKRKV